LSDNVQHHWLMPISREVYMEPPMERNKLEKIWKLKKAVYGMNDAGR